METKTCKICLIEKPVTDFYVEKSKNFVRKLCKSCERQKSAAYKAANREKVLEYGRKRSKETWLTIKPKRAIYKQENKERIAQQAKEYWSKPENKARKAANKRLQYQRNAHFRILDNCRTRIYKAIKHNRKTKSTLDLIGCSLEQLKSHIESQFLDGMTWENHGEWHIDHIQPCASFDLSIPENQKKCFHYSNLQPLWAEDNLSKAAKV